jgi:transposase
VRVVEVDRADRQTRRRQGKSDPADAISAARTAQSDDARRAPKSRDGAAWATRHAAGSQTQRPLANAPPQSDTSAASRAQRPASPLRRPFHHGVDRAKPPRYAPQPGDIVGDTTRVALRELGRRAAYLQDQINRLDALLTPLVAERAASLLGLYGVGPEVAAILLVAAGDHPDRLRNQAAWAHLCPTAPILASSGKITRWRLNPLVTAKGNHALWRIVLTPMNSQAAHPRLREPGATPRSCPSLKIIRCLTRYVARQVYCHLRPRHSD